MALIASKTPMAAPNDPAERMLAMIEKLKLDDSQRDFMRDRWWDQITWMDATARRCQWQHRTLRLVVIVCGVLAPALVSATLGSNLADYADLFRIGAIVAGLLVAISTAAEELYRFGQRWRQYRQTSEQVRSEGWRFITLSGPYRRYRTHAEAFRVFAQHVEEMFQQDLDTFTHIFRENDRDRGDNPDAQPRLEPGH